MDDTCEWTENEDGLWDSACGGMFEVLEGTPIENAMNYCSYCGKRLKETRYVEPAV